MQHNKMFNDISNLSNDEKLNLENQYVMKYLELSKKLYRYILDDFPKHKKFKKMSYQDKFLILKALPEYSEFIDYFPIVTREMLFNMYHDKAFKKFLRYIFNYKPSDDERVKLSSKDKMLKMGVLNSKNARYVYYLHYYTSNKKSKDKSEEYYESYIKELNKDSETHYKDYINLLEESNKKKEEIKERYKQEILKELNL